MQLYVYAVAIVSEHRRMSAQAGRPRLDPAGAAASAVWKSEVGRASDRPSPLSPMRAVARLPSRARLRSRWPSRAQAVGAGADTTSAAESGDVDRGLTNDYRAAGCVSVRPSASPSPPCVRPATTTTRHDTTGTEPRKPRGSGREGCQVDCPHWNVTQSCIVTNGGKIGMDGPPVRGCQASYLL